MDIVKLSKNKELNTGIVRELLFSSPKDWQQIGIVYDGNSTMYTTDLLKVMEQQSLLLLSNNNIGSDKPVAFFQAGFDIKDIDGNEYNVILKHVAEIVPPLSESGK